MSASMGLNAMRIALVMAFALGSGRLIAGFEGLVQPACARILLRMKRAAKGAARHALAVRKSNGVTREFTLY
ncbi:hypothetical protein [Litorivita sp. NS0012-18]|uniref:hypothetical protein n=1 Tax=Litorivita sp. NS0012-18 TaxID=3127655 RepID=UPI0033412446